jgi:putative endonuclease
MLYKVGFVYMMSSPNRTTLYTGMTSDLLDRVTKHRTKYYPNSFSAKYNCVMLVYCRGFDLIIDAIAEEKRIKGGSRSQKEKLIESINPNWEDLYEKLTLGVLRL